MAAKRPKPNLKTRIRQWVMDLDRTQGYSFEAVLGRWIDLHQLRSDNAELKKLKSQREKLKRKGEMAACFQVECKIKVLEADIRVLSNSIAMDRQKLMEYKNHQTPWLHSFRKPLEHSGKAKQRSLQKLDLPSVLRTGKGKVYPIDMHVSFAETGTYRVYTKIDEEDISPRIIVEFHDESQQHFNEEEEELIEDFTDCVVPIRFEPTFRTSSFKYMSPEDSIPAHSLESDRLSKMTPESSIQSYNS
jgi:hypothetical protein